MPNRIEERTKNMRTILLSFTDHNKRDEFISIIRSTADALLESNTEMSNITGQILSDALSSIKLDPPIKSDLERIVALFVSGKKKSEGSLSEMNKQFALETGSHSASVELKELREGTWIPIRSRKIQR